jgi:glucose-1-phosphate thymidylyltransferase
MRTTRVVVLARGLGTRMREPDPAACLDEGQRRAADAGSKTMLPIRGRPFLDYGLSALADAGLLQVALVVAPAHQEIRAHYTAAPPSRVILDFVVQPEPLGTANAVLAAEPWTGGEPFLVVNADNLYPATALHSLASLAEPGLAAFERDDLVRSGNIPAERLLAFALVEVDDEGYLAGIVEKPGDLPPEDGSHQIPVEKPAASAFRRKETFISMNCWRFDARIFDACRDVPLSSRGERELPEAVALATRRGVRFRALPARGPVLDLSRRGDAADVERRLAEVAPRP